MATAGDLFGFLVSDLVPKSTEVRRFQEESELRFGIQQQLTPLVCVERTQLKYCIKTFNGRTTANEIVFTWITLSRVDE